MALTERLENIAYNADLRTAQAGILYFRSTVAGTITKITIYRSGSGFGGVWIYNVRLNGTALFAGAGRPQLALGDSTVIKSGLSVAVAEGDVIQLDLEQNGLGVQLGHVVLVVEVELSTSVMTGPGTSTDDAIALFDGTAGDTLQDSAKTISTDGTFAADSDALIPTQKAVKTYVDASVEAIGVAVSDEATALTTGTAKITFRMPYAFTLSDVRASVTTAPTGAALTVDINEGGSTILSTKLTIDASEKTSTTAATPAVISDASLADDAEITVDIDQVGSTIAGAGLKIWLIGVKA